MKKPSPLMISSSSSTRRTPCCSKVGMKRGPWTAEEDELLSAYIKREGEGRWRTLPKRAGLHRCGKSCRLRWMNYLRPNVKRGHISPDEEDLILRLHRLLGNKWSLIAGRIPGRTDNEIKNYWNTHLSKKLINQGIDPRTHKPLFINPNSDNHRANNNNNNNNFLLGNTNSSSSKALPNLNSSSNPNLGNDHRCCHEDQNGNGIINLHNKQSNINGDLVINEKEDYININFEGIDNVFSSFLNSLMNEEMFDTQNQQQQSGTSSQTLVFGAAGWDTSSS